MTTPLTEVNLNSPTKNAAKKRKRLSVERIYTKKTQLEHILLRPDTYIGSVEPNKQNMWVYDDVLEAIVNKEISYVPGLFKIFDEILVNAADNKQRDPAMSTIKVEINTEKNFISIWNDGRGIPVEMHKEQKVYVPTMIFGQLLTSSNYNDEEKKVTGGRNGYGAKLCNIFSKKFSVETACADNKLRFKQVWTNNMGKTGEPVIKDHTSSKEFTCIVFFPDLEKFKMESLDRDTVSLMSRRAYDIAASVRGVSVVLNGQKLKVKSFKDYVQLCLKGAPKEKEEDDEEDGKKPTVVHEIVNSRWEICVTVSDKGFQQASFVNSIATTKGGTHVNYVTDQIVDKMMAVIKKKNKGGLAIKPFQIKNHLWVFINCLIENPAFDSQTKENMTLRAKDFGSKCELSDKFIKSVQNCGVLESVMNWMRFKEKVQLSKKCSGSKHSKIKGVPKLDDANDAGGKNSRLCTLILTEGDSAKTLAVSGLSVVGRDRYGVFPLRGKLLNVRDASHKQILENAEINNIIKITGLQYNKQYKTVDDLKALRYGHMMIMTDQDQDGSHIKGLVINFIHSNWPSLLKLGFMEQFITPIVKVSKAKQELAFYSIPEFEEWQAATPNHKSWKVKYYKGLGTSTPKEAKEYFADMDRHKVDFHHEGAHDDEAIVMAFSKKKVQDRKDWLTRGLEERKWRREQGLSEVYLYEKDTKKVSYCDFVNKELILFSNTDNERSIPSLVDGLKPGQRKVMFTCMKRNDKREVKVAQLAGSVAELSAYHHGETSLMGTIINLAQNFVGSNNVNLLQPVGQFGTRLHGGKDAASPRYIFTMLSPVTRLLFHASDESNLKFLFDDNQRIEPEWYCPIIPTVLINGTEGIGTGYSTKMPNFNPREIVDNIKKMMNGEEPEEMIPWYKNFTGTISKVDATKYLVRGIIEVLDERTLEITELPVGTWTQTYKEQVLEPMLHGTDKIPPCIIDYKEYHTDTRVMFTVTMAEDKLQQAEQFGLHKKFKLETNLNTSNMVLFDAMGCLRKYDTTTDIVKEFFKLRMERYIMRKAFLEGMLSAESGKLNNQARFILEKIEGTIVIENKPKRDLITMLVQRGYPSDPVKAWKEYHEAAGMAADDEDDDTMSTVSSSASGSGGPDFNYLLNMSMWSLSQEKKDELLRQRDQKAEELNILRSKSPKDLWTEDLDAFLAELEVVEQIEREDEMMAGKSKSGRALKAKPIKATSKASKPKKTAKPPAEKKDKEKSVADAFDLDSEPAEKPVMTLADRLAMKRAESTSSVSSSSSEMSTAKKQASLLSFGNKPSAAKKSKKAKKGSKGSDDEDEDTLIVDFSDSDESSGVPVVKRTVSARAKAPSKFNFDDDYDDEDDSFKSKDDDDDDFVASDDGDDDFAVSKPTKSKPSEKPAPKEVETTKRDVQATRDLIQKLSPVKQKKSSKELSAVQEESDGGSSSSSGVLVIEGLSSPPKATTDKAKKAPAKKAPAKGKKSTKVDAKQPTIFASMGKAKKSGGSKSSSSKSSLSDSDDELGTLLESKKSSPKKKTTKTKTSSKAKTTSVGSDEDEEPAAKKPAARKRPAKAAAAHDDSESDKARATNKPAARKRPAKAAAAHDDSDSDASVTVVGAKKSTKTTKKKPAAKSSPKRKKVIESSDDGESADEDAPAPRAVRSRRGAQPVKYAFGDSDDDEEPGNESKDWMGSGSSDDSDFN